MSPLLHPRGSEGAADTETRRTCAILERPLNVEVTPKEIQQLHLQKIFLIPGMSKK